jgi:hypothetical protein
MIRTLLIASAFAAVSGAAFAAPFGIIPQEVHISLVGKDPNTIRTEVGQAARLVCQDVTVSDYAPCVTETYRTAMDKAFKIQAANK